MANSYSKLEIAKQAHVVILNMSLRKGKFSYFENPLQQHHSTSAYPFEVRRQRLVGCNIPY
jgi:hypothetical protein